MHRCRKTLETISKTRQNRVVATPSCFTRWSFCLVTRSQNVFMQMPWSVAALCGAPTLCRVLVLCVSSFVFSCNLCAWWVLEQSFPLLSAAPVRAGCLHAAQDSTRHLQEWVQFKTLADKCVRDPNTQFHALPLFLLSLDFFLTMCTVSSALGMLMFI